MNGITEIIEHLTASNISGGEAMAALEQAKGSLQAAHDKVQDSWNHAAAAQGAGNSDSLNAMMGVLIGAKSDIEMLIAGIERVPDFLAVSQEKATDYVGRLMG